MKKLTNIETEKIQAGSVPCGTILPHGLGIVGAVSLVIGLLRSRDCFDEDGAGTPGGGASGGAG